MDECVPIVRKFFSSKVILTFNFYDYGCEVRLRIYVIFRFKSGVGKKRVLSTLGEFII